MLPVSRPCAASAHPRRAASAHPRPAARGFLLIEVLVALVIFSIGIVSLVSLQYVAMQQSSAARYRADAALLANELIGRMWVTDRTPATLATYAGNGTTDGAAYTTWKATLPAEFTSTAPVVTVAQAGTAAAGTVTVTLQWKGPSEAAGAPSHRYTAVAQIR